MSQHYPGRSAYVYPSKIEPDKDLKSAKDAHAWDRDLALALVGEASEATLEAALLSGAPELARALRWLADEIDEAAPVAAAGSGSAHGPT